MDSLFISYPEMPITISEQLDALLAGRKTAVMLTLGQTVPSLCADLYTTKTDIGIFIHRGIADHYIEGLVEFGLHGSILGYLSVKAENTDRVVVVTHPEAGHEAHLALCRDQDVEGQKEIYKEMFPGYIIESGDLNLTKKYMKARVECFRAIKGER